MKGTFTLTNLVFRLPLTGRVWHHSTPEDNVDIILQSYSLHGYKLCYIYTTTHNYSDQ